MLPRLLHEQIIFSSFFFDSLIKTSFRITSDEEAFKAYNGPKLNYSGTVFQKDVLQIIPYGLLAETGIHPKNIHVSEWNNLKIFFQTDSVDLPFDIFSASFYLVSRYEEYLSHKPDEHLRFHHNYSLAYKNNFLDEPLINHWAEELKKTIQQKYPSVIFFENTYKFIPTVDIDIAYAHLGRNLWMTLGSYFKAVSKFQIKTMIEKKLVLLHLKKDPYDTYDYQESIFKKYKLRPIYFFLAGKRGRNDKNISPDNNRFKKLVNRLSAHADIGIHPSYNSNSDAKIVKQEVANVERNIPTKISRSRQHFLRLTLPETYGCLAELGITDDYTMAYAGQAGFRASICTPFLFYDLQTESVLPIKLHSTIVMDGTLNEYLHLTPGEAISITNELLSKVKKCKGEFIFIWHNHSLSDTGHWKGWKVVFENILETGTK